MSGTDLDLDLSKVDSLAAFLEGKPFASSKIEPLSGGNANYVFRLHLHTPYEGNNTLVLKHAKPHMPLHESVCSLLNDRYVIAYIYMRNHGAQIA